MTFAKVRLRFVSCAKSQLRININSFKLFDFYFKDYLHGQVNNNFDNFKKKFLNNPWHIIKRIKSWINQMIKLLLKDLFITTLFDFY